MLSQIAEPFPAVEKIAVLRANRIGDFIVTLPALAALRATYPPAELVLPGRPWHANFLTGRPGPVDRVVPIPPSRRGRRGRGVRRGRRGAGAVLRGDAGGAVRSRPAMPRRRSPFQPVRHPPRRAADDRAARRRRPAARSLAPLPPRPTGGHPFPGGSRARRGSRGIRGGAATAAGRDVLTPACPAFVVFAAPTRPVQAAGSIPFWDVPISSSA